MENTEHNVGGKTSINSDVIHVKLGHGSVVQLNEPSRYKFLIPIFISLIAVYISYSSYQRTVQSDEARIVIPQVGVQVIVDGSYVCPEQGKEFNFTNDPPCWEVINPTLKNIGNANARNIRLEIHGCFMDDNINFKDVLYPTSLQKYEGSCAKYWDDVLVSELPPDAENVGFGKSYIPFFYKKDGKTDTLWEKDFVLIFNLTYIDALTDESRSFKSFYKYQIGAGFFAQTANKPAVSHLLASDYAKLYPRLLNELGKNAASSELTKYIQENSPTKLHN